MSFLGRMNQSIIRNLATGGLWSTPADVARAQNDDSMVMRGVWGTPRGEADSDVKVSQKFSCYLVFFWFSQRG